MDDQLCAYTRRLDFLSNLTLNASLTLDKGKTRDLLAKALLAAPRVFSCFDDLEKVRITVGDVEDCRRRVDILQISR